MILEVKNINKSYVLPKGIFSKEKQKILNDISFFIKKGECLGIIGESGSGKSTIAKIIMGIEKADSGEMLFQNSTNRANFRKKISIVFQDYTSSVNPRFKIHQIINEPLLKANLSKKDKKDKICSLLDEVGLNESFYNRYPHELSGGQLQRVAIARAISNEPEFLLLDEAVSSLDVSIQLQVIELLMNLKTKKNLSYLFITHDLLTITYICDRILFFQKGEIVEQVNDMNELRNIKNPYAKSLLEVYL